jgi:hypothetical protein
LRYLLKGEEPTLSVSRVEAATDRLFADCDRSGLTDVTFERNALVSVPGVGEVRAPILAVTPSMRLIVGIHGPLTPDHTNDPTLRDAKEYGAGIPVLLVDEIVVARNLPHATRQVIEAVT